MRMVLGTCSFLALTMALASAAPAQTAPVTAPDPTATDASADTDIIVSGTRLRIRPEDAPTPVVTLTSRQLDEAGSDNLAKTLIQLPSVGVGLTDTNTQNFYASAGLNLVDLRHLGYNRTLVLVNGRRQVPSDVFTSAVDLNTIPVALVERVDVTTGGSSAVYGADAVSGVVNIILKKNFTGLELRARGGVTSRGDGESYGATLTGGTNFADGRGNITVSGTYDKIVGVKATARSYADNSTGLIANPAATGPGTNVPLYLTRTGITYYGPNQQGLIDLGPFGAYVPTADGRDIRPYNFGALGNQGGILLGGDGGRFSQYDNLQLPTERYGLSASLTYKIADAVELFGEARILTSKVSTRWQPAADFEYGGPFIATTNPYVPARLAAGLAAAGAPGFYFQRVYEAFGLRGADDERTTQQYTLGLRGDVTSRIKYEAFVGYGHTRLLSNLVGGRDQARFLDSVNVTLINGQPACASATARANGCQPLNVFNPASTPAGVAHSLTTDTYSAYQDLKMVGGNLSGDLLDLPAGPLGVVLGVEARENRAATQPSAAAQAGGIQLLFEAPERGRVSVKEAYGELRVPVLKDLTLVKELTFQGAASVSDYNVNGTHWSWNLGGTYSPTNFLKFRGARSRSVRAPNVDELYATQSQTFLNITDPCSSTNIGISATRTANCRAIGIPTGFVATTGSKATYVGGNRSLNVETADTWTVGVAFTPRFLPGFSATVDWFDIKIDGAIGAIPAQTIVDSCVDNPVAPASNPLCSQVTRDAASRQITGVYGTNLNVGALRTRGLDVGVNYASGLDWVGLPGRVGLTANFTYLDQLRELTNAADPRSELRFEGYAGRPNYQALGTFTYAIDKLAVTWRLTYYGSTNIRPSDLVSAPLPANLFDLNQSGVKTFNDLSIAYDVTSRANLRVNVNNIFDTKPPARALQFNEGLGNASIYPNLGTTFSAILTYKF